MQYNVKQSVKNILLDKVLINNEGISLLYIIDYLCHESWSWGIDNKAAYSNLLFFSKLLDVLFRLSSLDGTFVDFSNM